MADLSLTPNDPNSRQEENPRRNVFYPFPAACIFRPSSGASLEAALQTGGNPGLSDSLCPTELEFSLRQRRWMLFYEIQLEAAAAIAATFFGNRTPRRTMERGILRMGAAAITHAATAAAEIDDGNIFGCAADGRNGVIKRQRVSNKLECELLFSH